MAVTEYMWRHRDGYLTNDKVTATEVPLEPGAWAWPHGGLERATYWYTLDLSLEPGANELVFAVSESFGGWGVMARLL